MAVVGAPGVASGAFALASRQMTGGDRPGFVWGGLWLALRAARAPSAAAVRAR
jgi:hypothetical protein